MLTTIDKRDRAALFRQRLIRALALARSNRSALARAVGVDRSTVSQLLKAETARLPNAQLAADLAQALGVSLDWLLGLTERPERPGDVIAAAVTEAEAARSAPDEHVLAWHREAAGYKIRHVPATLPDMLKSEQVLRWEYAAFLGRTPDQAIVAMRDRLDFLRDSGSDYELAVPIHEVVSFARGEGYWHGLPEASRKRQLALMADTLDARYPALRLFLFDAKRVFSAPLTVFGPLVGVLYVGRFTLAFRESTRIRSLTLHFDWLVREAEIDARDAAAHLRAIAESLGDG